MKGNLLKAGILAALTLFISGCDTFRSMAGRPTSEDIEAKRQAIAVRQAEDQARADSVRLEEERVAKLSAAREAILDCGLHIIKPEAIQSLAGVKPDFKYALMLGSFKMEENAGKLAARLKDRGYGVSLLKYSNGAVAVAACPSDDPITFLASVESLRKEEFCPEDAWVLFNE